jgi:serine/threonine-protein kinase RsbW
MMPATAAPPAARQHTATCPGDLTRLAAVRASLRDLLRDVPSADDAVLCASELAANAIRHSHSRLPGGTITIRATIRKNDHALIEVTDNGGPWVRADSPDQRHGLDLVHALAADWDISGDYRTRTVWARIPWHPAPPRHLESTHDLSLAAALHHARYSGRAQWSILINGPRLSELRHLHGLSREILARQARIGLATLARLERQPSARCRPRTMRHCCR